MISSMFTFLLFTFFSYQTLLETLKDCLLDYSAYECTAVVTVLVILFLVLIVFAVYIFYTNVVQI